MNVNTQQMGEYANFLDEKASEITGLCNEIGEFLIAAVQCMDQQSGRQAAHRLAENLDNIKKSVPISSGVSERLVLAKKIIEEAINGFGR